MRTYSEFKDVQEHNPLAVRNIIKKINPLDKLTDKIKRKGISGMAKDVLKKKIDKLNPFSDMNKEKTKQAKKDKAELRKDIEKWQQKIGVARAEIKKLPKTS